MIIIHAVMWTAVGVTFAWIYFDARGRVRGRR